MQKKYAEAIAEFDKGVPARVLHHRAIDYARAGRRDEALRLVNELEQRARTEYVSPGARGLIWIELGEADRGYALVETPAPSATRASGSSRPMRCTRTCAAIRASSAS